MGRNKLANNAFRVQGNLTFIPPLLYLLNHQEQATGDKKARVIQVSSLRAWEGGQGAGDTHAQRPCGVLAPGPSGRLVTLYVQRLQSGESLVLLVLG